MRFEVGLVCDAGSSQAGVHGLTDLFRCAGAPRPQPDSATGVAIRIAHWTVDEAGAAHCQYDSEPGTPHHPSVLVLPGNLQATETDGAASL